MTTFGKRLLATSAALLAATVLAGITLPRPTAAFTRGELLAHRAVYDLQLAKTRGKTAVAARGRILYDFTGSVCEGYTLQFRQVTELDNGEGRVTLSDLRSNTWEEGAGKTYRFNSENYLNQRLVEAVDGKAERHAGLVALALTKPKQHKLDLEAGIVFPTEHVRRIIVAAREGKTILEFPVYDGSDGGQKVYNTLTVIGRAIAPSERVPTDAAAGQKVLAGLPRWPVTVSYFDRAAKPGEQTPIYAISFELYENGVSRALVLDYNDFSIRGELSNFETKTSKSCP
ncbi:MAG: cell envelope integrity EipB family protein [Xanthobacteraceae bacterium]